MQGSRNRYEPLTLSAWISESPDGNQAVAPALASLWKPMLPTVPVTLSTPPRRLTRPPLLTKEARRRWFDRKIPPTIDVGCSTNPTERDSCLWRETDRKSLLIAAGVVAAHDRAGTNGPSSRGKVNGFLRMDYLLGYTGELSLSMSVAYFPEVIRSTPRDR
jgi:hypothetical protein